MGDHNDQAYKQVMDVLADGERECKTLFQLEREMEKANKTLQEALRDLDYNIR